MTTPTPGEREARLSLPFPPSVNNLFLNIPGRGRVRSPGYRKWANEAGWIIQLAKQPKLVGPVCVHLALKAPDKRLALHSAMKAICASLSPADRLAAVARAARAEQGRAGT